MKNTNHYSADVRSDPKADRVYIDFQSGGRNIILVGMTPKQALALAKGLKEHAKSLEIELPPIVRLSKVHWSFGPVELLWRGGVEGSVDLPDFVQVTDKGTREVLFAGSWDEAWRKAKDYVRRHCDGRL